MRTPKRLATLALLSLGAAGLAAGTACTPAADKAGTSATTAGFAPFVDRYLDGFARRHPSIAAGNGLHDHDDLLDDFSAQAIAAEIAALKTAAAELAAFSDSSLTPDERVDKRILAGVIDGWLLEQETLANWKRNPMTYASALSDGVHNLMTMENDAAPVRMRRIIAKLAGVPAFLQAARTNIVNPPRIFAERGLGMMRGASTMLTVDLPVAFAAEKGTPLMDSLLSAAAVAAREIDAYTTDFEKTVLPTANGEWKIGGDAVARRYRSEELIDVPLADLAALGERELKLAQDRFRAAALRLAPGADPQATWLTIRRNHPKRGEVVAAAQAVVDSLTRFIATKNLAVVPEGEHVVVKPAQPFSLGFASMHASPPLEKTPVQSVFYITDADSADAPAQQEAWLERFNFASLAITSAHEAMPGHWLHSVHMRQTPGKIRRIWIGLNPFPQPSSGQDGWAHYSEELVVEQGFMNGDPRYELAQLSDALTRICRLLSGIRLHTGEWTLEQAQACFEQQAYVAAPAAKREAQRGTYDPTYGGYFLGKRGMLTLRRDVKAAQGDQFNLRDFHERVMKNGIAPIWAHRQLLMPGDTSRVIQ
ncbi:DUF885 domain-containing protein [Gemmatimonas groenlandica]|uniref:DUF885 domain-containing protein n=1 Tax=Gemmatimonas groenlandica TaxID=2732249 RepID=A0A6M4INL2_9BACT|nr:DUF885 domain-containing protein [Gemmatimonas groenlandica]QJR36574.1 DUF885 domain-containing protein [Gemmatimonas groenlandica]